MSNILDELSENISANRQVFVALIKKSPNLAYQKVNELAAFVGSRHGVDLQLHFPRADKIRDVDSYGTENVGIVVDKFCKNFTVPREAVKAKAIELIGGDAKPQDAYMYEGKEGVRVVLGEGQGRIEILPGSVHFWCRVEGKVRDYGDWLLENVYSVTKSREL